MYFGVHLHYSITETNNYKYLWHFKQQKENGANCMRFSACCLTDRYMPELRR